MKKFLNIIEIALCIVLYILTISLSFVFGVCCGSTDKITQILDSNITLQASSLQPADTVSYSFIGSNVDLPCSFYTVQNDSYYISVPLTVSVSLSSSLYSIDFYNCNNGLTQDINIVYNNWTRVNSTIEMPVPTTLANYVECKFSYGYYISSAFDFKPVKIRLLTDNNFFGESSFYGSMLYYYDSNDNYFALALRVSSNHLSDFYLSDRTYYLSTSFDDNESYVAGYNKGKQDGLADNQQTVYDDAFNSGKLIGDALGYERGLEDANQYTFLNLLGAVVDAPIQAFIGLLNFDLLGFNMLSFCTSLLTLSLIIMVVRFVFFRR